MATALAKRVAKRRQPAKVENTRRRVELVYTDLNDIVPYERNARDNEAAIPAVAESIKNFGFLVPCVIDKDNVLIAGHTRVEAAKLLGLTEVPCVLAEHLTPDQVDAFRLVDNKTASLASWDEDLLSSEISRLMDTGIEFGLLGWTKESLDCLSSLVSDSCLDETYQGDSPAAQERRAPVRARCVIGSVVFFIAASDYRRWEEGIKEMFSYNDADIVAELKRRLGITEESVEASRRVARVRRAGASR